MAQQFKVLVNAGKSEEVQSLLAEQGAGQRGRPLIIKAKAGAKYQLVEMGKAKGNNTDLAPDNIKAKRVGKHLHLMFETDTVADVIIEDYYDVTLNAGEVIKIYDATGTVFLGNATVDPATKTWTYESPTPAEVGTHPYVAKIESATSSVVATSNTYTVDILGAKSLDITAISTDSGTAGDFITSDNTIVYNGTLPQPLAATEKVRVQIFAANGTTLVRETTVTPASGSTTWTWDNSTATALADGNYVIKATIVAADGTTPVAAYGARGTDTQPMTIDASAPTQTVTITSMTKDSGIASGNADWTTADGSAGRLVSGSVSAALGANEMVKVYANGAEIGNATVSGTQWEITDLSAYNANWTYTAKVVDTTGGAGPVSATTSVTLDTASSAVTISSVMETGGTTAITDGSGTLASTKVITTVNGTGGTAGDIVYVYDSSSTNLIGSATVAAGGAWSITGLSLPAGPHTFAAVQRDALGNISPNSNLFKLAAGPVNTAGAMTSHVTVVEEGGYSGSQVQVWDSSLNFYPGLAVNSGEGQEAWNIFFKNGPMSSVSFTLGTSPDVQYSTQADPTRFKFYNAEGKLLQVQYNGKSEPWVEIINTTKTHTVTFEGGETATRMMIDSGKATAFTVTNLALTPVDTNTLTPNTALGVLGTPGVDGMTYNGGTMGALAGNDVITAKVATVQAQLAAGGIINGGAGVDTLKLQPATVLDLTAVTGNQTVKNIQEVEIFQMQGKSTLTMSANDVLSLGATELSGYSFASAGTSSTGKVQLVVQGTATDKLNLSNLASDGLGSNTGTLAGEWLDKGTASIGGVSYQVYDHSTTKAQVLVGGGTQASMTSNAVAISSMTLDTGTAGDFVTGNGTAGRTVTGTIATALSGTDKVEVYANGVLIGNASVSGTNWTITDTNSYTSNWTYTAKLVASSGNSSATTNVIYDALEAAPVITSVTDSGGGNIASGTSSSGNLLSTSYNAGFRVDNYLHNTYNDANSNSTDGPMTGNTAGSIYLQTGRGGDLYDGMNPTGPGSLIEMAAPSLVTVTKGQAYTMAFDVRAGGVNVSAYGGPARQLKWVLLDATGVYVADLTGWYSTAGVESQGTEYGGATRFKEAAYNSGWNDQDTYINQYVSTLETGQYRVAMASTGGGPTVMMDRLYFGIAKNPVNAVSGTGTVGSLIQLYDNGGTTPVGSTTVGADGTWTVSGMNLAAGTHSFTAKSTDAAGTVSAASVAYNATVTPVTLDLNGDGQIGYSQIKMDLNSDGILDTTSWVASQDGLLVHDMYGDGSVRENSQFAFARHGGETDLQGFAGQFDSNNDGVFDAKDAQFNEIAVWQDADQDGVADAGEVKHLAEMGITSIKLTSDGVAHTPATGVTETGHTSAQLANGATMVVADAAFDYTLGKADTVQADAAKSTEVVGPVALASQDAVATEQAQAAAPVVQTAAAPVAEAAAPAADATAPAADATAPAADATAPAADAAAADPVVDVVINELAPTGTEPVVLQPASALIQNKPYTLSPEQIAQFQAVVDAATAAAGDNAVDVTLNELAPTGLEPLVFQHVLPATVDVNGAALVPPTHCEPSVMVPPAPVDAAVPTDATAVVDQQQPTHCDEPWLIELNGPTGTEPVVFNLNPASWNKPFALSAEQLSELGLPVPADSNVANHLKLNVTDVLLTPADGVTPPALQINGAPVNGNTLNLSNLLGPDAAPTQLTATGTVQQDGQAFTFQVDATLQAMIDQQHLQHATMS